LRDAGRMAPRAPAPRQHRSPAEILEQISPPGIVLRLSFNDHRFKAETATFLHVHLRSLASPFPKRAIPNPLAVVWACLGKMLW
jgi:hypothetical protein